MLIGRTTLLCDSHWTSHFTRQEKSEYERIIWISFFDFKNTVSTCIKMFACALKAIKHMQMHWLFVHISYTNPSDGLLSSHLVFIPRGFPTFDDRVRCWYLDDPHVARWNQSVTHLQTETPHECLPRDEIRRCFVREGKLFIFLPVVPGHLKVFNLQQSFRRDEFWKWSHTHRIQAQ